MIDHDTYRRRLLSNPLDADPALDAHRRACAPCAAYSAKLAQFEAQLQRALAIEVGTRAPAHRAAPRAGWLALAASLVGAALLSGTYLLLPGRSLAAAVVAHMAGEPGAWASAAPVPEPQLQAVLRDAHVAQLRGSAVSYANSCQFRGHQVPHLVVQSAQGPVTVMILTHEHVRRATEFSEQGYHGMIVPLPGHGDLAVLMQAGGAHPTIGRAQLDATAAQVRAAIVWATPTP